MKTHIADNKSIIPPVCIKGCLCAFMAYKAAYPWNRFGTILPIEE